jgi:hypothetical protein
MKAKRPRPVPATNRLHTERLPLALAPKDVTHDLNAAARSGKPVRSGAVTGARGGPNAAVIARIRDRGESPMRNHGNRGNRAFIMRRRQRLHLPLSRKGHTRQPLRRSDFQGRSWPPSLRAAMTRQR